MDAGVGDPIRFIPPLAGSEWVTAVGANRIIRIVLNGLNGPITVKGQQYSGTAMLRTATNDRSDNWSPDELLKMPDSD